jgi:hypothetical protein
MAAYSARFAEAPPLLIHENLSTYALGTCSGACAMWGAQKRKKGTVGSCALITSSTFEPKISSS